MSPNIGKLASIEFAGRLIGRVFQYGITLVIANGLGADGLGTFAFAFVALQLSGAAARGGLDTALLKFIPIDRDYPARLTGTVLTGIVGAIILSVLLFGVIQLAAEIIPAANRFSIGNPVAIMLLGLPLLTLVRVTEAGTRGFGETKFAVYIREFGMRGIGFALVAGAVFFIGTVHSVIIGFVMALLMAVGIGIAALYHLGAFDEIGSPEFNLKRILGYALPVAGVAIANPMIIWTDILMLGFLTESSSVGYYRAAYQTAALLTFALVSVNAIFPPVASRLYNNNQISRLNEVYSTVTLWITGLTVFAALYATIYSQEILSLFGKEFAIAQTVLIVLSISRVVDSGVGPAGFLLSMTDNERLELINTVSVALLNLILNYIFIVEYGIVGAAVATTTSLTLLNLSRVIQVRWLLGIWPHSLRTLKMIVPVGIAIIPLVLFKSVELSYLIKLPIVGIISFVIFCVISWLLVVSKEDMVLIQTMS